ncbi:MAG: ATP-binding protein [bacterium]|nr:ATP-binding protein [bacterium]
MNLRKLLNNLTLRAKFIIPISILLAASVTTISSYLLDRQADGFRKELEASGETRIRMLAHSAESGVIFENIYELEDILNTLAQFEDVQFASISDVENSILTEFGTEPAGLVVDHRFHSYDRDTDKCNDFYGNDINDEEFLEFNYPIETRKEEIGRENLGLTAGLEGGQYTTETVGHLRLILQLDKVQEAISDSMITATVITIVVVILTILGLAWFVGVITKPIKSLVEVTDQVSRGDFSKRAELKQQDEIGHLASTFNRMVDSLEQSRDEIEEYNRNLEQKIIERTLELEEIQQQLVQSEKLSAIGQLAAGVAHELNNPLGGILGYSQFTLEKLKKFKERENAPKDIDKFIRYLTDIETQARRCKTIVQNLLRFSRSSRTTDFEDVDINQVVEDTRTFVEHQLHMNNIELEVNLSESLPVIHGNGGQLQQVLTNLIINAMHASPADSIINVFTRYSPPLGEFSGAIEIIVADQGTGISPENLNKIFEPFFTTKMVGKGTGLGLSVSYGIIKDHGGEVKVDSVEGEGSTFVVVLPVKKESSESDTEDSSEIANRQEK